MPKVSVKLADNKTEDILGSVGSPSIVLSELIKNSIDSNSDIVDIYIDTNKKEVTVIDKGDGLNEEDIKKLGVIGQSDKKEIGKEKRKDGKYYSGSKGLGLLSAFSLSDYIEIETKIGNTVYLVKWKKSQGEFSYQQIDNCSLNSDGTKVILKNISDDNMGILMDENEHKKLRHVTIRHFNNIGYEDKKINFFIDGKISDEFDCCDICTMDHRFVYKINFKYISQSNTLEYCFDKTNIDNNTRINKFKFPTDNLRNHITINLNNTLKINDIIKNTYKINKTIKKDKKFKYLSSNLEDFYGQLYVIEGQNKKYKKSLEDLGYGVKIFVNDFAIYEYLDNENDWLRFGNLSQNVKGTTLKPHNVFGYINFENFNEKESNLQIANERTNFIQKSPYKKFIEILKDIVVKIAFEVDVAYRLGHVDKEHYFENLDNNIITQSNIDLNSDHKDKLIYNKEPTNKRLSLENQDNVQTQISINTNDNENNIKDENSELNKINNLQPNKNTNSDNLNHKKINNSKIGLKNKPKFNFFVISNVIKTNHKINIGSNELIKQLKKLEYKNFYLMYVMAFRSILEDGCKRYLNDREIDICGDIGKNIRNMTDDMVNVVVGKNSTDIAKDDKIYIQNIVGGYNAYKTTFKTIGNQFYSDDGCQGPKSIELNSFVHNPRWMEEEEAEYIANDIIMPLLFVSQEILKNIKK